ncbi:MULTISPECIES: hypothetical protein [unclassified Mesorhizobium]|uniref:hypothetical protein n=1 Tax=unclassified Mesorhizobium TaxID=325217 RepID=UPI000FCAC744|nr:MULTISPECIES: hypothetical protein [unclassified Mesorhizobium]RUV50028.1 hypothetical protein EOA85_31445 [Mesorhizobium sp. M5C.F.Ca.IN.020.29.1.1]RWK47577.1 MAG: hypothetical protein EOR48_31955 [Mesorhizobium sp.]TIM84298.1 MAG: hypothetical protein E5Y50_22645 [Mesorhizobium sp.]TIP39429.1 MAG: hypothetical protein E5X62_31270 [Mesorhizobium sp.]
MFAALRRWAEQRRAIRRRWQADARALVIADEVNAYYEAQRRAARARVRGDRAEFFHWAKVAAEVARLTPRAEMDVDVVRAIAGGEERRQR